MSCTHDCGCSQAVKDARTDDWGQIAPESARGGCMADFDAPQAPQEVPAPERPANRVSGLPRRMHAAEADLRHIAECLGEDPDDVPEGHRLVDHLALRVGYLRGRDAGFDDVEAERDALAAQVARVEKLAEEWSTELDENRCPAHAFPGCDCHEGYHHAWDDLRAALGAMGANQ